MRIASVIARYLAGVIFLVMGLNGFLNFIPLPPPGGIAGQFLGALYVSHYLWVMFGFQVIASILLLVNRYVPLAVAMLAPVLVNILTFHTLMAPSGLPLPSSWLYSGPRSSSTCDQLFPGCSSRGCSRGPEESNKRSKAGVELEGRHEYQTYATI